MLTIMKELTLLMSENDNNFGHQNDPIMRVTTPGTNAELLEYPACIHIIDLYGFCVVNRRC